MSRWFRMYDSLLDDPKVQKLEPRLFKAWVNLLCVASRNDGVISPADAAFALRMTDRETAKVVVALVTGGLLDNDGTLRPHNWNGRQYKSDGSSERVKRFRERHSNGKSNGAGNADETLHGTGPDTDSESEAETERKKDDPPKASPLAKPPGDYAFTGAVVRLTHADFAKWQKVYSALPDLTAELTALDDWIRGESEADRKRWFHVVSAALKKRHSAALNTEKGKGHGGIIPLDF